MGQVASRRRQYCMSGEMKKKKTKKYPLEVWRQIKDMEIARLQEASKKTEKECEIMRKQFVCQSFLIREIFEDKLREQREFYNKEIAEMKKEIAKLRKETAEMKND